MRQLIAAHRIRKGKNMLRSMYSGISGLKNFQTKLDVIGNNISNVNTYGFKKGRVTFQDMISQTVARASESTNTKGGTNAMQVGLGSSISSIDTITTQGNMQSTGRLLDLAISGDGYFAVGEANATATATTSTTSNVNNIGYTRSGNFYLDSKGFLVNSEGKYVLGIAANSTGVVSTTAVTSLTGTGSQALYIPTNASGMSISSDGTVTFIAGSDGSYNGSTVTAGKLVTAGKIIMAKFSNPGGLLKEGSNTYQETPNSGSPVYAFSGQSGIGTIESSMLEMSNVDLSEEFTEMIVAQRAFQANTRIITTSDEILQELVNLKR